MYVRYRPVLVNISCGVGQTPPDRLLALALWSIQNTSPREGGNQNVQLEGEQALVFLLVCLEGEEACK